MKITTYPDGGKYVTNDLNEEHLVYRINSYEDLFLLKSIKDANSNLEEITIPCMFQQQHDRQFNPNESFELALVCEFINSLGFKKVKVFHPHSDVTPALLKPSNCEVISNKDFIAEVILSLYDNAITAEKSCILMSSDANGFKSLMKLCKELNWKGETYGASKSRAYESADKEARLIQEIDRRDFGGKDILLVDDICVYGGTFIGIAKMLKERNVGRMYLAVSHITVDNPSGELFQLFDRVFTTDSKGLIYYDKHGKQISNDKLTIINTF